MDSAIKQLDDTLKIIAAKHPVADGERYAYKKFESIFDEVKKIYPDMEVPEMQMILDKLIKDEFVYIINTVILKDYYSITFEGKLHLQAKGYQGELERLEATNLSVSQLQRHQDRMARRLFWINLTIAFGTSIAAIYYLTLLYCKYH